MRNQVICYQKNTIIQSYTKLRTGSHICYIAAHEYGN